MKKIWFLLCMGFMAVWLGGCGTDAPKSGSAASEEKVLVIGTMPDVDSIPLLIAQEKGFFREEGVNVEIKPFKSAMDRDSALQSGNLDGAISDMLAVAFAKEGGFDVKVTSASVGSYKLVAGKDEAISSVADLAGHEVALSKNTIIEYVTDRIAAQAGLADGDIHKVIVPQIPARLEMLQNGKVTAVTLPEPLASVAVKDGAKLIDSSDQLGINPGIMMFTAKSVQDKSAEIAAMYRAYNRAVEYLKAEPLEQNMDMIIEKCGFPPSVKGALQLPVYEKAAPPTQQDVTQCISWMYERGLIKKMPSYDELVTAHFVK